MTKFDDLFPVEIEYYDYVLPMYSFDVLWAYIASDPDQYTFLTKTNKMWSFCVTATTEDELMNIIGDAKSDDFKAVPVSVKSLTNTFRTIELNGQKMFIKGGVDFVCTSLQTHSNGPLYPSTDILCLVLLRANTSTVTNPDAFTITSEGKECVLIHDDPHALFLITNIHNAWKNPNEALYLSYVPMQVLADKYEYAMYETSVYNLKKAIALSASSLRIMSDEYKQKINNGEEHVF